MSAPTSKEAVSAQETLYRWPLSSVMPPLGAILSTPGCVRAHVRIGPRSLLRSFLSAGNLVALAGKLSAQAYLDSLTDQELADVWQRGVLPPTGVGRAAR